jgi:hypothetical protein
MTAPAGPLPSSVRVFLFGADSIAALADSFVEVTALDGVSALLIERLGAGTLESFRERLAHAAGDFMNLDPAHLFADGLRQHRELLAVAQQTADAGSSALLPLGTRRMSLTQHPSVDVEVDGETVCTVDFELKLTIDIGDLAAIVREGRLVELEGERAELTAEFSVAPGEVLSHQTVAFDANAAVPLGEGIKLA